MIGIEVEVEIFTIDNIDINGLIIDCTYFFIELYTFVMESGHERP